MAAVVMASQWHMGLTLQAVHLAQRSISSSNPKCAHCQWRWAVVATFPSNGTLMSRTVRVIASGTVAVKATAIDSRVKSYVNEPVSSPKDQSAVRCRKFPVLAMRANWCGISMHSREDVIASSTVAVWAIRIDSSRRSSVRSIVSIRRRRWMHASSHFHLVSGKVFLTCANFFLRFLQ